MTRSIHRLIGEALARLIGEAFAARNRTAPATPCLDADTAAAFVDDMLSADERSCAEAHVTDCARCQALLAALARTAPAAAPRVWWRRPAVAWLGPFVAAATAAIVWINVSGRSTIEPAAYLAREDTRAPAADSSPARPAPGESAPPSRPGAGAARSNAPALGAAEERGRRARASGQMAASRQESFLADSRIGRPAAGRDASAAAASSAAPERPAAIAPATAPEATSAAAPAAEDPRPQLPSTRAARTEAFRAPPPATPGPDAAAAKEAPQPSLSEAVTLTAETMERAAARRREAAREVTIVSPDPFARWRIGTDGSVQHSSDGGATWQAQPVDANVTPTAGSSPSRSVCWLVGRAGLVAITVDEGRSWQRLPFPADIDLRSVRATDDQAAIVVASDGRVFRTSDRGRTWRH